MRMDAQTINAGEIPCHKCQKRKVGCHGTCEDYAEWLAKYRDKAEQIKAEMAKYQAVHGYIARKQRIREGIKAAKRRTEQ